MASGQWEVASGERAGAMAIESVTGAPQLGWVFIEVDHVQGLYVSNDSRKLDGRQRFRSASLATGHRRLPAPMISRSIAA